MQECANLKQGVILMTKLVSNNQGLETARLARDAGMPRDVYQIALTNGTVKKFLTGLMPQAQNILWQNGSHKVVKNDDGTVSVWVDCDQIDWAQSNQAAIDATGRNQYTDSEVVAEMPRGEKLTGIAEVVFRKYGCYLSDEKLDERMAEHGEPMISPFLQAKINELFPEFADKYPNGTHWENAGWCYAAFSRWGGEPGVSVSRGDDGWGDSWWFGRLRK